MPQPALGRPLTITTPSMKPPQALASPPRVAVHSLSIFLQPFPQILQGETFILSLHTALSPSLFCWRWRCHRRYRVRRVRYIYFICVSLTLHQENGLCVRLTVVDDEAKPRKSCRYLPSFPRTRVTFTLIRPLRCWRRGNLYQTIYFILSVSSSNS